MTDTSSARGGAAAVAVLLGHTAATGLLLWGSTGALDVVRAPGPAPLSAEVALAAAVGAWGVLTWLTAVTVAALLTAVVAGASSRAHARAVALAPRAARRLVAVALGMSVVGGPLSVGLPAQAAERPAVVSAASGVDLHPDLDRPAAEVPAGWTPDRPAAPHRRAATSEAVRLVATRPHPVHAVADEVVVRRGDTLWAIAARHLGPDASAADVAREWPRWHAANRGVIGDDPDLVRPGMRLVPPDRAH